MKKTLFFLTVLLAALLGAVGFVAATEEEPDACHCGRPYYVSDQGYNEKYDCVECGQKISNCTCTTCWCGATLTRDENGGPSTCDGCGHLCTECTCADRATMLRYEEERRLGHVSVSDTPCPDNAWAALLLFVLLAGAAVLLGAVSFSQTRTETVRAAEELDRQKQEHDRILQKIEAQANGGKTKAEMEKERVAALAAVRWDIKETGLGVILYELTSAVRFARRKHRAVSPSLRYALAFAQNKDDAVRDATEKAYGPLVADAVGVIDFYEFVKSAYAEVLDGVRENELVHLANAACMYDLSAGAATDVMRRYAEGKLEAYAAAAEPDKPARKRFAEGGDEP